MNTHDRQKVIFQWEQVKQNLVSGPRDTTDHGAGHRVEDEMIGSGDDGDENGGRVRDADKDAEETTERGHTHAQTHCKRYTTRTAVLWGEGNRHDGQADEERVAKVQRRHGGVLVAELVCCPHAGFARCTVHSVDEAEAAGFFSYGAWDVGVREETWWHAGPEGEDDEGDQVARGHGSAPSGVENWAGGTAVCFACWLVVQWQMDAVDCSGVVVQAY